MPPETVDRFTQARYSFPLSRVVARLARREEQHPQRRVLFTRQLGSSQWEAYAFSMFISLVSTLEMSGAALTLEHSAVRIVSLLFVPILVGVWASLQFVLAWALIASLRRLGLFRNLTDVRYQPPMQLALNTVMALLSLRSVSLVTRCGGMLWLAFIALNLLSLPVAMILRRSEP